MKLKTQKDETCDFCNKDKKAVLVIPESSYVSGGARVCKECLYKFLIAVIKGEIK